MAQDFLDLTGQIIKKATELVHGLEQELLQLGLDFSPSDRKREGDTGLLNGPQITPSARSRVVSDQSWADYLLENLGF